MVKWVMVPTAIGPRQLSFVWVWPLKLAIAARPESWGDMVRPGVILYGYHPGYDPAEQRAEAERRLQLKPVMSLRTRRPFSLS